MRSAVVLVTDYGLQDGYDAALVGACLRVDPDARCVSGTHQIPPGDVAAGSYALKLLARAFPARTVFCAVVDPEVGTARRAIAIDAAGVRCVGPDNGLVSYLWREAETAGRRCVELSLPPGASATFHGRDLFAPVAARLAVDTSIEQVGQAGPAPMLLDELVPVARGGELSGRVVTVDRFGNCVLTVRVADLAGHDPRGARWGGGGTDEVVRTYAEIRGPLALLVNSAGHLEVASRGTKAAGGGGPGRGEAVTVLLE